MKKEAGFSVVDAKFERRVRESFSRQGLMKHLGADLVELNTSVFFPVMFARAVLMTEQQTANTMATSA